jgi:hypothetical protein
METRAAFAERWFNEYCAATKAATQSKSELGVCGLSADAVTFPMAFRQLFRGVDDPAARLKERAEFASEYVRFRMAVLRQRWADRLGMVERADDRQIAIAMVALLDERQWEWSVAWVLPLSFGHSSAARNEPDRSGWEPRPLSGCAGATGGTVQPLRAPVPLIPFTRVVGRHRSLFAANRALCWEATGGRHGRRQSAAPQGRRTGPRQCR